jgi:hypothetical protein
MNMELRVSEHWLNGFNKAAEAMGLTPEQVPSLFRLAQRLETRAADPETFDKGAEAVLKMEKVAINIKSLLLLGLGGGAALGGSSLMGSFGRSMEDKEFAKRMRQAREIYSRNKTHQLSLASLPGMGGGQQGGYGMGGYGQYPY